VPCGISDKAVTSLGKELGHQVDMRRVKEIMKEKIGNLFKMEWS
jgi:lipoyl(octanoyl) transferase